MSKSFPLSQWAYAFGRPACDAIIRTTPEDFIVDEELGFDPDGDGNHALLHIRKRNTNTEWLARQLAELAEVPLSEIGYAGLKDRHAVTTQYFSVNLSGKSEPDWQSLTSDDVTVIDVDYHRRKLKRGQLLANRFRITLRALSGDCAHLQSRLERIREQGVPNYFGSQRFGHAGANLDRARELFSGKRHENDRHRRGLYLSAARSYIFNKVLDTRVASANWNRALPGESVLMSGTRSAFTVRLLNNEVEEKVTRGELEPSGPLWGRGKPTSLGDVLALEQAIAEDEIQLCDGLARAGLEQERRALRLSVKDMQWEFIGQESVQLEFRLAAGTYATSVIRELVNYRDVAQYDLDGSANAETADQTS